MAETIPQIVSSVQETFEKTLDKKLDALNLRFEEVHKENGELRRSHEALRIDFGKLERLCEKKLEDKLQDMKSETCKMVVVKAIEEDAKEQEKKADYIKILGIKEKDGETEKSLKKSVESITKMIGAEVQQIDIKEIRRVGLKKNSGKLRGIVAKIDTAKKVALMEKKKSLKGREELKNSDTFDEKVLIFDDLTEARERLLRTVRGTDGVEFAFVKNGYILAKKTSARFTKVENADDLFHLGIKEIDYALYYKNINRLN